MLDDSTGNGREVLALSGTFAYGEGDRHCANTAGGRPSS